MRVLSAIFSPFLLELYGSIALAVIAVGLVAYFERSRLRPIYEDFRDDVLAYIGLREVVYILILTVFFLFLSIALHMRTGETELLINGYPKIASIEYYGTPLEMFGIVPVPEPAVSEVGSQSVQIQSPIIIPLWIGLLLNLVLFSLIAFAITFTVTKVRYLRELSRR
jgi:hypothetical protein